LQAAHIVDAQHHGVRVVEAREVMGMISAYAAAAAAAAAEAAAAAAAAAIAPEQDNGIVWVGIKCVRKGYPQPGASIHAASVDDYKAYLEGQGAFEGERDVIGFVSSSQVRRCGCERWGADVE
jgi:opacity protein-like surface antigen